MHPLTAIDIHRRAVEEQRREALAASARIPTADADAPRRRRVGLPRLLRRRIRTA